MNDYSTDDTEKVINDLRKQYSFIYIRNQQNRGAPYSRNIGVNSASGEFIIFLDDDDEWYPERLAILIKEYNEKYSYVASLNKTVIGNRSIVYGRKKSLSLIDILYANFSGSHPLILKSRLIEVDGYDEMLDSSQDWDLYIRLIDRFGSAKIVQQPLYIVYSQEKCISNNNNNNGKSTVYNKYKHKMNFCQRRYNECLLKKKVSKINIVESFLCLPIGIPFVEYINMLKTYLFSKGIIK